MDRDLLVLEDLLGSILSVHAANRPLVKVTPWPTLLGAIHSHVH